MHPLLRRPIESAWFMPTVGTVGTAVCGLLFGLAGSTGARIIWVIGLVVSALLPQLRESRNALAQSRAAADKATHRLLAALAATFDPDRHVRTNIMLFSDDRIHRRVHAATAFNMTEDPDRSLEVAANAGVSGKAVLQRKPVVGDLSLALHPGGPDWGLTPPQKALVRRTLRSILSCPIFDPDDPDGDLLGTLQIDSDATIEEIGFDQASKRQMAQRFADAVSLLLKAKN